MAEEKVQSDIQPAEVMHIAQNHPLQLYFNQFVNNIGVGDITTLLLRNGAPVGVLQMSPTTAKTFATFLTDAVAIMERQMGQTFMTSPELLAKIVAEQASSEKQDSTP
jgi:hypothetical protein